MVTFSARTGGEYELVRYSDGRGRVYHVDTESIVLEDAHLVPDVQTLRRLISEWAADPDHRTIVYSDGTQR